MLVLIVGCSEDNISVAPVVPPSSNPPEYVSANGIRGGRLYDKFWSSATGWNQADTNLTIYNGKADFFRCKQCHGWDLLGNRGAYISRGASASRPNRTSHDLLLVAQGKSPQELFEALKSSTGRRSITADLSTYNPSTNPTIGDQMPDYSIIFTDTDIWDLVKFLKNDAIDVRTLYSFVTAGSYPTGSIAYSNIGKDGNAANGDAIYLAKCIYCHGADGRQILVDGGGYTVGSFIRAKPNEGQHKIKFGQLGSLMGSFVTNNEDMKDLYKALSDTIKYPRP